MPQAFLSFLRGAPRHVGERLADFFTAKIRNGNNRAANLPAVVQFWNGSKASN